MSVSPNTICELKKITAQFDFLLSASSVNITNIPCDERFCVICQEPFNNKVWKFEDTVNRPVKLACGHIFGIQCLAHLVFTSDFSNRCPLCRAQVIPESCARNPSAQSWKAALPLLGLLMMFGGDLRTFHKKKGVYLLLNGLERDGLTGLVPGKHMDRIMVLYEEVLTQFCDHPQPRGDADRIAAAETQVQSLWDLIVAREDLIQAGEASRVAAARRQELARSEAERQLKDLEEELQRVKEELQEAKKKGRRTQKELQVVKEELLEVNEEFREVKKRKRGTEKELEGVKNELEKAMEKVREELDGTKTEGSKSKKESEGPNYELNEARKEVEGIRKELHKARETATKESQETIESLDAKACLAGFWILCSLGLVVVLACMVCS